jgi:prepilin-type N-terminal cleavage/methylation domain-containing protein
MHMKTRQSNRQLAFTLIELITVISIIAILMALLFPALSSAKESARRAKAGTVVKDIVNASKAYVLDYGKFPPVKAAKSEEAEDNKYLSFGDKEKGNSSADNDELFNVLRAISRGENQNHALNKRQVKYFEQPKATDSKNPREGFCDGSEFAEDKQGQLMDPWGTQYCVVLDADGDEAINLSKFYTDLEGEKNVIRYSGVAFSLGKDKARGGKGYENKLRKSNSAEAPDDIISWQ